MKLIAQSISGRIFKHPVSNDVILSSLHGLAVYPQGKTRIFRYYDDGYAYSAPFRGGLLDVHINEPLPGEFFALEKGLDFLAPVDEVKDLAFDQQYAIYFNNGRSCGFKLVDYSVDGEGDEHILLVVDLKDSSIIHRIPELHAYNGHFVGGRIYYLERDHIQAYDKDFKPAWRFDIPDPSFNPAGGLNGREVIAQGDTVIANFYVDPNNNYAGSIYCWAKDDGALQWRCDFDVPVEDVKRYNDNQLLAVVGGKLCLINAETGQVDAEYETGLLHAFDRKAVHFYGDIICLYGLADNKIQFYQRDTFELLREVDCTPFDFKFYKFASIQHDHLLFIPCLQNSHKYWQFCGSMLMIDLTDIHAELTVEQGPHFDIQVPTKDNGAIRLSVNHNDWGDIVRFAERHFAELVYEHGKSWLNPKSTKHFNGHLELTVTGCDAPELTEKLKVFEKRMLKIIENDELHDKPITVKWVVE